MTTNDPLNSHDKFLISLKKFTKPLIAESNLYW